MDIPTSIDLRVGEEYTVRLKGLGTVGYAWSAIVTGEKQAVSISEKTEMPRAAARSDAPEAGTSADELFTLHACAAGNATIQFVQRRAWLSQKPPLKEVTVEVHVHV